MHACTQPANICAPACLLRCRGTQTDTFLTADTPLLTRTATETKQHRAAACPSACGRGRSRDAAALAPCVRCSVGVIDSGAAPSHPRTSETRVLANVFKKKKRGKKCLIYHYMFCSATLWRVCASCGIVTTFNTTAAGGGQNTHKKRKPNQTNQTNKQTQTQQNKQTEKQYFRRFSSDSLHTKVSACSELEPFVRFSSSMAIKMNIILRNL